MEEPQPITGDLAAISSARYGDLIYMGYRYSGAKPGWAEVFERVPGEPLRSISWYYASYGDTWMLPSPCEDFVLAVDRLGFWLTVTETAGWTEVPGSPFQSSAGQGYIADWQFSPDGQYLLCAGESFFHGILVFQFQRETGQVREIEGSPFPVGSYLPRKLDVSERGVVYVGSGEPAAIARLELHSDGRLVLLEEPAPTPYDLLCSDLLILE